MIVGLFLTSCAGFAAAGDQEAFSFFEEEAKVITASRLPTLYRDSPATIHVITSEDIRASGASTIYEALRSIPGVDVIATKAAQGEVGIRGLDRALNNRVLVLLDGKTVHNAVFDLVVWENIPVVMEDIERIEVVEGPASALYGPNAISGVINIITKKPEQIRGAVVNYTAGERKTQTGTLVYGNKKDKVSYKFSAERKTLNRFEDNDLLASAAGKFQAYVNYDLSNHASLSFSGGVTDINTQTTLGAHGASIYDGIGGFLRLDLKNRNTRYRFFRNSDRSVLKGMTLLQDPELHYDIYNLAMEHSIYLPYHNNLTIGTGYQWDDMVSGIFTRDGDNTVQQNLWALFFENEWKPVSKWRILASGRLDKHPLTDLVLSPRGSVMFQVNPEHSVRFSVATSFRNPTPVENYLKVVQTFPNPGSQVPNPPFSNIRVTLLGNKELSPERMTMFEVAHTGFWPRCKTNISGFYYKLKDLIVPAPEQVLSMVPPILETQSSFMNKGEAKAWGSELEVEMKLSRRITAFTNYSYLSFKNEDLLAGTRNSPKHKVNTGLRAQKGGFAGNLWFHWIDKTFWYRTAATVVTSDLGKVASYTLLNAHIGYTFSGHWEGLNIGIGVFNLGQKRHFEILPVQSATEVGQNGEIIDSKWTADLSYSF